MKTLFLYFGYVESAYTQPLLVRYSGDQDLTDQELLDAWWSAFLDYYLEEKEICRVPKYPSDIYAIVDMLLCDQADTSICYPFSESHPEWDFGVYAGDIVTVDACSPFFGEEIYDLEGYLLEKCPTRETNTDATKEQIASLLRDRGMDPDIYLK